MSIQVLLLCSTGKTGFEKILILFSINRRDVTWIKLARQEHQRYHFAVDGEHLVVVFPEWADYSGHKAICVTRSITHMDLNRYTTQTKSDAFPLNNNLYYIDTNINILLRVSVERKQTPKHLRSSERVLESLTYPPREGLLNAIAWVVVFERV